MRVHPRVLVTVVLVLLAAACGSGGSRKAPGGATPGPTVTSRSVAPPTFGGVVGSSSTQACLADARAVQDASNAYIAVHGKPAPSLADLVKDGQLRSAPATDHGYTIGYDAASGTVTASGACNFG